MKQGLSMNTRHQIVKGFAKEYAKATKREKGILLDYLCASTGWSRANARRRLSTEYNRNTGKVPTPIPRRRASKYQLASYTILERIWTLCGDPCGKYLAATVSEDIERLERFNEFGKLSVLLTDEVKTELKNMSAATMDRHLKKVRDARYPLSLSATKPGSMLRSEIKVRW
jgi:hypothetical protein